MDQLTELMTLVSENLKEVAHLNRSIDDPRMTAEKILIHLVEMQLAAEMAMELMPNNPFYANLHADIAREVEKAHDHVEDARLYDRIKNGGSLPDDCN